MPSPAILTLTLNPAIDYILTVDALLPYDKNIVNSMDTFFAGKGVNVAYALGKLGSSCQASGFMGAADQRTFNEKLQAVNVKTHFLPVEGRTRTAIKVMDSQHGNDTEFNQKGFQVNAQDISSLLSLLQDLLPGAGWLALSGSLPEGAPTDLYAHLINLAREHGVSTCLDASGQTLISGLEAKPTLLRVNRSELEEAAQMSLADLQQVRTAIGKVLGNGVEMAVISMGGLGVIASDGQQTCWVQVPQVSVVSLTGAGDTLTAGCLYAFSLGQPFQEALRFASALATASTLRKEPGDFSLDDLRTIQEKTTLTIL